MKSFFSSLVLTIALIFTLSAEAGSNLKDIIDDLNYALTVEWDQKNPDFYKDQIRKFNSSLITEGINKRDLFDFLKSDAQYASLAKDPTVQSIFLKSDTNSQTEDIEKMIKLISKHYMQGANWNGRDNVPVGVLVAFIGITVGMAVFCSQRSAYYDVGQQEQDSGITVSCF